MRDYLQLMRIQQWMKNLFIFTPVIFAFQLFDLPSLFSALVAFISFSLAASSLYIYNDIHDIQMDKLHPRKRSRPIASGKIDIKQAYRISVVLAVSGLALAAFLGAGCMAVILVYLVINIAYTLKLKHIALIDIFCIATGFVLRVLMGGYATSIALSQWIIVITFLLAVFLALSKRRDDMLIFINGGKVRKSIEGYNIKMIDYAMAISAAMVLAAYLMYCISPEVTSRIGSSYVYITFPFVLLGLMRYLQITFVLEDSGCPTEILLKDRFIQSTLVGWLGTFLLLIYK